MLKAIPKLRKILSAEAALHPLFAVSDRGRSTTRSPAASGGYGNAAPGGALPSHCPPPGRRGHASADMRAALQGRLQTGGRACQASADADTRLFLKTLHSFMQALTAARCRQAPSQSKAAHALSPQLFLGLSAFLRPSKGRIPYAVSCFDGVGEGARPSPLMCCRKPARDAAVAPPLVTATVPVQARESPGDVGSPSGSCDLQQTAESSRTRRDRSHGRAPSFAGIACGIKSRK